MDLIAVLFLCGLCIPQSVDLVRVGRTRFTQKQDKKGVTAEKQGKKKKTQHKTRTHFLVSLEKEGREKEQQKQTRKEKRQAKPGKERGKEVKR